PAGGDPDIPGLVPRPPGLGKIPALPAGWGPRNQLYSRQPTRTRSTRGSSGAGRRRIRRRVHPGSMESRGLFVPDIRDAGVCPSTPRRSAMRALSEVVVTFSAELWAELRRQAAALDIPVEWLTAGLVCDTIEQAGRPCTRVP